MRSTTGTVVSLAAGLVVIGALALIFHWDEMFSVPAVAFFWFVLLGVINYPLGRLFNFTGVHLAGIGRASPILSGAPLVAATMGITLLGETMTLLVALGTVAIIGGIVLILTARSA